MFAFSPVSHGLHNAITPPSGATTTPNGPPDNPGKCARKRPSKVRVAPDRFVLADLPGAPGPGMPGIWGHACTRSTLLQAGAVNLEREF